jgi:diadenosine tetraphosphate (Ap4A) HIT family hydrolase
MPTIFTRIIAGEIPGTFVWRDAVCVGFMSINPINTGHVLVVPVDETDHWIDLPAAHAAHLMTVSQTIGQAQHRAFGCERIGLIVAGFEVPHCHIHLIPMEGMQHLSFANAAGSVTAAELEAAASPIRAELSAMGASGVAHSAG